MIKIKRGEYTIRIYFYENRMIDVQCNCMFGTIHKKNWWLGLKVCHHISDLIKERKDFKMLCQSCHIKEDYERINRKLIKKSCTL